MIDWLGVFNNALWIVGLAVALAAVSYADWQRHVSPVKRSLREALALPSFQIVWSLGLLLFCVGLALTSHVWWQMVLWALLALAFLYLGVDAWRRLRSTAL
ncbi:MAG: hypothetical protein WAZ19_13700 [Anaerolineae bacterium]